MSITECFHCNLLPLTLTAKKSTNVNFLADKIYYNSSQEYSKITYIYIYIYSKIIYIYIYIYIYI